jgi:4-amino-4-deoxy-L-arabinose transferase-like glycosyltransferase
MMNTPTPLVLKPDELPDWMRRARLGFDWGLLIVAAMVVLVGWPFIVTPSLPQTNSSENYVYRTALYATALREGTFYPRWSANSLWGYGAPIPNFYPPLPAYTSALIQIVFTDDPVNAVRCSYLLGLLIGGCSLYLLVMRRSGAPAGILSALLFVSSPYMGLIGPHVLGDLQGVLATSLISLLLWCADSCFLRRRWYDPMILSFVAAGLCMTSPGGFLVGLVITLCWSLWQQRQERTYQAIRWVAIGLLLGIGVSSIYWIPAFLEAHEVRWYPLNLGMEFQLSPLELLQPLRQLDPVELVPSPQTTLGIPLLFMSIFGSLIQWRYQRRPGYPILCTALMVGGVLLGMLMLPNVIWILGVLSFLGAIAGSGILSNLAKGSTRQRVVTAGSIVLIWVGNAPVWLPRPEPVPFPVVTPLSELRYQLQGYGIATLARGEWLPSRIDPALGPDRWLIEGYEVGNINKIRPGITEVSLLNHSSQRDNFQIIRVGTNGITPVLTNFFPGWQALVNGVQLPLSENTSTGQLNITLSRSFEGSNLTLSLVATDVQWASSQVSLCTALIAIIWAIRRFRKRPISKFYDLPLLNHAEVRLICLPLAWFALLIVLFTLHALEPPQTVRPGYSLEGSFRTEFRSDSGLQLYAFRVPDAQRQAGNSADVMLYWRTQQFLQENYQVRIHLVNTVDGSVWANVTRQSPGYYPTRRWNTQQYISDRYRLVLPATMPVGNYQIQVEVCDARCSQNLNFYAPNGDSLGQGIILPTLLVIE